MDKGSGKKGKTEKIQQMKAEFTVLLYFSQNSIWINIKRIKKKV